MAQIRVVAPEVVQQGRDENLEQGGASVGGHVVWGEVADKVESEDGLPVSGEQDLELVLARGHRRVQVGGRQHAESLPRIGLEKIIVQECLRWAKHGLQSPMRLSSGGSSSGSTSDNRSRGPEFNFCWEPGFFLLSSLFYHSISGASLIRALTEV